MDRANSVSAIAMRSIATQSSDHEPAKVISEKAEPSEPMGRIRKLIKSSKDLVVFYKNGLKLLWDNGKKAKALRERVAQGHDLTRAEFQLVHRSGIDMLKLVPFGLIFVILPESVGGFPLDVAVT